MRQIMTIGLVLTLIVVPMNPMTVGIFELEEQSSMDSDDSPIDSPLEGQIRTLSSDIRLWEAWAKGDAIVRQTNFGAYGGTYTVYNYGSKTIIIDEYILLMSPSPAYMDEDDPDIDDETQDGVLTITHRIAPGSSFTYKYGEYVAMHLEDPPPWWCTEDSEYTHDGIEISLSGEIFPYVFWSMMENYTEDTQDDIWDHLRENPTVVVGKLPLWEEIDNIGDEVNITLEVTNIGFEDAENIMVTDKIPSGFSYDPSSFTHTPLSITNNSDGSITIKWKLNKIDAAVETPDSQPTDYTTEYIGYKLITPVLNPDLRIFLPRTFVDKNGNGKNDAESEKPLLETILVNRPPVAIVPDVNILENNETACLNGSASYDPDTDYGDYIISYEWDLDDDGITDEYGPIIYQDYGDNGNFKVKLTVTDSYGASGSAIAIVKVQNIPPKIDHIPDVTVLDHLYEGEIGTFQARAQDPGSDDLTFTWDWGDTTSDTVKIFYNNGVSPDPYPSPDINPMDITHVVKHVYASNGIYDVTVTVKDDDSGVAQEHFRVTVLDLGPNAEFDWSPKPQVEGSPVQFTDLSTSDPDDIVGWKWNFAGLDTSNKQNPEFTFPNDGIYPVMLTVIDDDGSMDSCVHNVTILDLAPDADFIWTPEPQDEGKPVQFTDISTSDTGNITAWLWDFAGLGTSNLQHPQFTFMDNGIYMVTLTVWDDDGSSSSVSHNVTIRDLGPTAKFTWSPSPQDEGAPVQFTDLSTSYPDVIVAWEWTFVGVGTSNQPNPQVTFMDHGIYIVILRVTDDDGSQDICVHNITILDLAPQAEFSWSPEPQDEGSPVQFTDLSTSYPDVIVSWLWDFGGLDSSDKEDPQFIFMDDGTYVVTLTVTDDDGSTHSKSHNVTIRDLAPTANFQWSPEPQSEGSPVQFTDNSTSYPDLIVGWMWDFGDGGSSTLTDPIHIYGDNDVYLVTLTVTDDDGSTDSISYNVTILNVPPTIDAGQNRTVYEGDTVSISCPFFDPGWLDTHIATIAWGDGTSDTGVVNEINGSGTVSGDHVYGDDGVFIVTVTVTDDDGDSGSDVFLVMVNNVAPSIVSLNNHVVDENTPITLNGHVTDPGSDDLTFTWNWGDGTSDTVIIYYNNGVSPDPYPSPDVNPMDVIDSQTHTYGDNGVFIVTLTVKDDDNGTTVVTTNITVNNVAPQIEPVDDEETDENQAVSLSATAYDPGSDDLTFTWDWGDGTSDTVTVYYNNGVSPDPPLSPDINPMNITDFVSHTYGDNGVFTVTLTVKDDDGDITVITIDITVHNVAPEIDPLSTYETDENVGVTLSGTASDPGSDDLTFTWDWGDGTSDTITIYYNNGISPDPYPSPEINPITVTDTVSHTYGDNGVFTVTLTVEDDDNGVTQRTTTVTVNNVAPTIDHLLPYETDENLAVSLSGHATDPGSDDLTFTWSWGDGTSDTITIYYNNGVSPDPYPSPEINPRDITDVVTHTYGDNGVFTVTLTVEDDDNGVMVVTTNVTVYNVAPSLSVDRSIKVVDEGSPITLEGHSTDPGSDDLTFTWNWGYGASDTNTIYYNNGASPDPYPSPEINPMDIVDSATHTYGDNGNFDVLLTVVDDDGGEISIIINVIVRNVAPTVKIEAFMYVDLTLRIAGEKYHSVGIHLLEDGKDILAAMITRRPGNPDEQTGTIVGARIDVTKTYTVLIDYLPNDPRVNGNVWGANPVWVDIGFEDGDSKRLHHTFNVRKSYWNSDHWNHIDPWEVELNPHLLGHNITLEGIATDPGSDDLTFTWDFGDGATAGPTTYYNNGVSPDPYPSPDINPMNVTDTCVHAYTTAGTYTITLVVEDDDGAVTVTTLEIGL
ncbi:MAG: PKD domain-containing protein [Thermoplasmata archaeon]|nr:MAG: PKD domain-containing protein [Thermoplasmata archaeon]